METKTTESIHKHIIPIAFLLGLLFGNSSNAQYQQLLHKPYIKRAEQTKTFIQSFIHNPATSATFKSLEKFKQFAIDNKDRELELEAELVTAYYLMLHSGEHHNWVIQYFEQVIENAQQEKILQVQARAYKTNAPPCDVLLKLHVQFSPAGFICTMLIQ